ncbi:MAG TPA: ribbon-helix-helix domain-containing protein [Thermoanaerobaculia bacterium]|nr:ribbon-helix-helix domain-containing protein [Thermoanaerobaculia bacterium]
MPQPQATATLEAEVPSRVLGELQALVDAGWFASLDEAVGDALRRFLDSHREAILEAMIREDVAWGLHGRD